jgi:ribonuclease BN (tRNA processing enzyme)
MLTCAAWRFDEVAAGVMPLEPRSFGRLTVVTLGTGGAYENHLRRGPAIAVAAGSDVVLVDAGRGVAEALRAAKIPVTQPGTLLLTHLLPENTLGLDDLLVMGWQEGRREPVRLKGPAGTAALARDVEAAVRIGADALSAALALGSPPRFEVEEVAGGDAFAIGELRVSVGALPGGPTPALAWRFERGERSAVVSGAGWGGDALSDFARGAKLLVHQAAMVPTPEQAAEQGLEIDPEQLRREAALNASFEQVGDIARRAGAETLVLVRLRPPPVYDLQVTSLLDDHYPGRVVIASDGDELTP